jgi:hypothetical protein
MSVISAENVGELKNLIQIQLFTQSLNILLEHKTAIVGSALYSYLVPCYIRDLNPLHATSAVELVRQGCVLDLSRIDTLRPFKLSTRCHNDDCAELDDLRHQLNIESDNDFDIIYCVCCEVSYMLDEVVGKFKTLGSDVDRSALDNGRISGDFKFRAVFDTGFQNSIRVSISTAQAGSMPSFDIDNLSYSYHDGFRFIVDPGHNNDTFWFMSQYAQYITKVIDNIGRGQTSFDATNISDRAAKKIIAMSRRFKVISNGFTVDVADGSKMSNDICSVCCSDIECEGLTTMCGHHFHIRCIFTWWQNKRNCPNCKAEVVL